VEKLTKPMKTGNAAEMILIYYQFHDAVQVEVQSLYIHTF